MTVNFPLCIFTSAPIFNCQKENSIIDLLLIFWGIGRFSTHQYFCYRFVYNTVMLHAYMYNPKQSFDFHCQWIWWPDSIQIYSGLSDDLHRNIEVQIGRSWNSYQIAFSNSVHELFPMFYYVPVPKFCFTCRFLVINHYILTEKLIFEYTEFLTQMRLVRFHTVTDHLIWIDMFRN